jgi:hypothetical protein
MRRDETRNPRGEVRFMRSLSVSEFHCAVNPLVGNRVAATHGRKRQLISLTAVAVKVIPNRCRGICTARPWLRLRRLHDNSSHRRGAERNSRRAISWSRHRVEPVRRTRSARTESDSARAVTRGFGHSLVDVGGGERLATAIVIAALVPRSCSVIRPARDLIRALTSPPPSPGCGDQAPHARPLS